MKDTGYWSLCKECAYSHEGACTLPGTMCRPSFRNKPEEKERKCDFESFYKNANDNDCMAYLHCGKYVVPIKLYNMQIERSTDIYPEFTLKGCWMAGSSEKDPSITISKVIFNPPATIVFWKDGSKTVVKCQDGDVFDPEKGLAMAFMKKAYGNTGKYCDEVKKWVEPYDEECVKKQWTKFTEGITDALKKMGEEAIIAGDGVREVLERAEIEHPGIVEEAKKLATETTMSTEEAVSYIRNREGLLSIVDKGISNEEEKENKEMKRTLTKITTIEITEVYNLEGEFAEVYDDGYKRTMSEFYKDKLDVDDVVVTKVQAFVSENDRK